MIVCIYKGKEYKVAKKKSPPKEQEPKKDGRWNKWKKDIQRDSDTLRTKQVQVNPGANKYIAIIHDWWLKHYGMEIELPEIVQYVILSTGLGSGINWTKDEGFVKNNHRLPASEIIDVYITYKALVQLNDLYKEHGSHFTSRTAFLTMLIIYKALVLQGLK
jgi:hypothetical protein